MLTLWQQNRAFIAKMAFKYAAYEEIEDLKQEGYFGLCNAVEAYNLDSETSFLNYAAFWIKQAMQQYIDKNGSCVRIPTNMRQKLQQFKKFERMFYQYHGRKPTDTECYLYLGYEMKEIARMRESLCLDNVGSLDIPLLEGGDDTRGDFVPAGVDIEQEVLDRVEQEELSAVIWPLVDALPGQQGEILRKQYIENLNIR